MKQDENKALQTYTFSFRNAPTGRVSVPDYREGKIKELKNFLCRKIEAISPYKATPLDTRTVLVSWGCGQDDNMPIDLGDMPNMVPYDDLAKGIVEHVNDFIRVYL